MADGGKVPDPLPGQEGIESHEDMAPSATDRENHSRGEKRRPTGESKPTRPADNRRTSDKDPAKKGGDQAPSRPKDGKEGRPDERSRRNSSGRPGERDSADPARRDGRRYDHSRSERDKASGNRDDRRGDAAKKDSRAVGGVDRSSKHEPISFTASRPKRARSPTPPRSKSTRATGGRVDSRRPVLNPGIPRRGAGSSPTPRRRSPPPPLTSPRGSSRRDSGRPSPK